MPWARWSALVPATLIVVVMLGQLAGQAAAQTVPGNTPSPTEPAAEPAPAATDELRAELERLLEQVEDPAKARKLAEGLRAVLAASQPTPDASDSGAGAKPPEEPSIGADSLRDAVGRARPAAAELLARFEANVRQRLVLVRQASMEIYRTAKNAPDLLRWTGAALDEPADWRRVARRGTPLVAILGSALLAMWLVSWLLRRARRALVVREHDRIVSRVIVAAGLVLLRAVPILVFALLANGLTLILAPDPVTRVVVSSGVSAIVLVRLGLVLAQAVLSPIATQARLVPLPDAAASALTSYVHWFLAVAVYGQTLISVLHWYGLPWAFEGTLTRLMALVLFVSAVWIVIRNRRPVGEAIGGLAEEGDGADWTRIPWRRIGAVWHVLAVLYLFALFVIYTIQGGALFLRVLTGSMLTFAVLVGLVVALRYVERSSARLGRFAEEEDEEEGEGAADRTEPARRGPRPQSLLSMVLRIAILLLAVVTFLQVWGLGTWAWLFPASSGVGEKLLDIALIVVVTYVVWLVGNRFASGYIRRLDAQTASGRSSTRTRTVLVLARNALLVTLYLIAGLVVLSELGVDIAPLLAGAGVIGIAIGFGSQRLVQDVITGLFNLIEDTFAVGDVVDLGGKAGVVEAVTIRTVRLRDLGGNVHTIPFGAIDVVTNMTKEFAFALFEIGVAYRENVDQVMEVIKDLGEAMRRERAYRRVILEPLEMLGLDQFADSAVVIKCRMKVRAGSQWMIGREFNRRLKNRFDELGIEIPFPHQTLYFGEDRSGKAPPARVVIGGAEAPSERREATMPSPRHEEVVAETT